MTRIATKGPDEKMLDITARMKPLTSKGFAIVTMLCVAAVLLILRFGPPRQVENMAAAEKHIQILRPIFQQNSRFTNITLHPSTGTGGSLVVSGQLLSDTALADLKQIVVTSKPPVEVAYYVHVIPTELLDEMRKTDK